MQRSPSYKRHRAHITLITLTVASKTCGGCGLSIQVEVARHHRVPRAGHDGGEGTSLVPRPSSRLFLFGVRLAVGVPIVPPSAGMSSVPSSRTMRQRRPASACQIMTIQNRRNRPKKLVDLESDDCRWPLGEPRSPHFRFCAAHQLPGYPYCERHCRIAFHPAKPRIRPPLAVPSRPAKAA